LNWVIGHGSCLWLPMSKGNFLPCFFFPQLCSYTNVDLLKMGPVWWVLPGPISFCLSANTLGPFCQATSLHQFHRSGQILPLGIKFVVRFLYLYISRKMPT
jgi:hypothetical protein